MTHSLPAGNADLSPSHLGPPASLAALSVKESGSSLYDISEYAAIHGLRDGTTGTHTSCSPRAARTIATQTTEKTSWTRRRRNMPRIPLAGAVTGAVSRRQCSCERTIWAAYPMSGPVGRYSRRVHETRHLGGHTWTWLPGALPPPPAAAYSAVLPPPRASAGPLVSPGAHANTKATRELQQLGRQPLECSNDSGAATKWTRRLPSSHY